LRRGIVVVSRTRARAFAGFTPRGLLHLRNEASLCPTDQGEPAPIPVVRNSRTADSAGSMPNKKQNAMKDTSVTLLRASSTAGRGSAYATATSRHIPFVSSAISTDGSLPPRKCITSRHCLEGALMMWGISWPCAPAVTPRLLHVKAGAGKERTRGLKAVTWFYESYTGSPCFLSKSSVAFLTLR